MNAVVIELVRGRDGKRYPVTGNLPPDQRNKARWAAHNLCHRDHHSIRAAQKIMLDQYAIRRSIGSICQDLARFECPSCRDG